MDDFPEIPEKKSNLLALTVSPTIWALHLLLSYGTAALWCGMVAGRDASLWPVRVAITVFTLIALTGIGITGRIGWQWHSIGSPSLPHHKDTALDRHRFIGFATFLLSGLSAIATFYVALTALLIRTCY